jgi:outer membrane protein TolC
MPAPALAAHRFDPRDGLDVLDVAMLAVANNPSLRLARDDLGLARAQAFAAGLLPDPQLSASGGWPTPASPPGSVAFSYGLSIDVVQVLMNASNRRAAGAHAAQTDLGLLWQEWQVIAQAKTLFVRAQLSARALPWLAGARALAFERYRRALDAAGHHELTGDALALAQLVYQDASRQYTDAQRAAVQTRHDLNALLGLAPTVRLVLRGPDDAQPVDPATLEHALAELPWRRPDLLALKAGYTAQQIRYRAAILGQFPNLTIGFVRTRDTAYNYTSGFQINLNLPIFNRNRGNIAIERATRQRMKDEYQTRVNEAYAEVDRLRGDSAVLAQALANAEEALPEQEQRSRDAERAYAAYQITIDAFTDAQTALLARRIDIATLRESLAEQRIALQAVLGASIPDTFSSDLQFTDNNEH